MADNPSNSDTEQTTHFGYKTVPVKEKSSLVEGVFDAVAQNYDVMNDIMSLGTHRLVKRFAIELSAIRPGQTVLDLAGGTGDFSLNFSKL
ncbi:MAG: class I SAM-dependent methyltransferase, partial [Gammaproteobacteria bacterium]|nr:class I SAM-dependent methyltransferase [Gammaproteobacteria bacterium]